MEPRIQYATTSDGVDIAYATAGGGPPLLVVPLPAMSHAQATWDTLAYFYQPLAEHFHLVWFDFRGAGLSDRSAIDFSMDAMVRDLEAVVESAGLTDFAIYAFSDAVPVAVKYVATSPRKISSLVLADGWAKFSDFSQSPGSIAEQALRSGDWVLYTETLARVLIGFENQETAIGFAAYMRECVDPEALRAAYSSMANDDWDVSALLPRVSAHTLVIHNRNNNFLPVQIGQRLAARIPNARFQVVDDMGHERTPDIINAFLGVTVEATPPASSAGPEPVQAPSGTAIILFADIVDSTALTERLGDTAFREKARGLDEAMRAAIRANDGKPVEGKTLGDGVLAVFTSAKQAIACAQACHEAAGAAGLALHVGIHAGDVIREADTVYGGSVNISARVAAVSDAGETLVSGTVRDLARTSAGVTFKDRGEQSLKGIDDPVRLFAVIWRQQ